MNYVQPRRLKGFADYDRRQSVVLNQTLSKISKIFERYGFLPLYTPTLEYKDILMNKYGEDSHLVYSFTDHGGREVAMRYDLTVPFARHIAENINSILLPFKRYQMQPVWRADNTQKGRSREFMQCDVDFVGVDGLLAEVEVLSCILSVFSELGLPQIKAHISNRAIFDAISSELSSASLLVPLLRLIDKVYKKSNDELAEEATAKHGFFKEDLVVLNNILNFIRSKGDIKDIEQAFVVDKAAVVYTKNLFEKLNQLGFGDRVVFDLGITRGLDYYTGVVFEFFSGEDGLAFGSGGRYDGLVSSFADKQIPGMGGSIGITRVMEVLMAEKKVEMPVEYIILNLDDELIGDYLQIANILRAKNISVDIYSKQDKLDKQFRYAESLSIPKAIIFGTGEKQNKIIKIKDLNTRQESVKNLTDL